jgi:hypothetical protein
VHCKHVALDGPFDPTSAGVKKHSILYIDGILKVNAVLDWSSISCVILS